jgi:hypothetical protein
MEPSERTYYLEVPPDTARRAWQDFGHELDFPGRGLTVRFDAAEHDAMRTRLCIRDNEPDRERADEAVRRFRMFLDSEGLGALP